MRWFKHYNNLREHPFIVQLRTEFGSLGYAAVCLILEKITGAWEEEAQLPDLTLPLTDWQALTGLSPKKLQNFFEFCRDPSFMEVFIEGKKARVCAHILLKLQDEYRMRSARKSGQTPELLRTQSATDKQQEQDICKRQENRAFSKQEDIAVRKVLRANDIDPDSARGERCYQLLLSKKLKNPAGYLMGILKKNPNFELEGEALPRRSADNPVHVSQLVEQAMKRATNNKPLDDSK